MLSVWLAAPALADDEPLRYVLGAALNHGPEYWGAQRSGASLRPVFALDWKGWRFSSAGGGALLDRVESPAQGPGQGASRVLLRGERLLLGLGLRLDKGRDSDGADSTRGLPDVGRTVRGRLYASYRLGPDRPHSWRLGSTLNADVLGRDGGLWWGLGLSREVWRHGETTLDLDLSLAGGDGRYLRSYFGVPADSLAAQRLGAYRPGAGLRDAALGLRFERPLGPHWVMAATVSASRLLGPAAHSPLAQRRSNIGASFSLGWRN